MAWLRVTLSPPGSSGRSSSANSSTSSSALNLSSLVPYNCLSLLSRPPLTHRHLPPQPQLRTYPPIRGPIMSLASLPPQYRRDTSASSASSSGLHSPSPHPSTSRPPASPSVAALIRAYERQRQIESMNVARGWDRQRPNLSVGPYSPSPHPHSSSSSPSSLSPHWDPQPHSAPLRPPHLTSARFSPLLIDQPLRPSRLSDQRRRSAHTPQPDIDPHPLAPCPPWLTSHSLPLFSLRPLTPSPSSSCVFLLRRVG